MTAGLATLDVLETEDGWTRLAEAGRHLETVLGEVLDAAPIDASLARVGSMFWLSLLATEPPRAAEAIPAGAADIYGRLFHRLLAGGIAIAPSAYEIGFVSLAHSLQDLDRLADGLQTALAAG
jgi:glutamate-1-semialdehyde 2,1-aminomutase